MSEETTPMYTLSIEAQELLAALKAADRGNWELLEQYTQEQYVLAPQRTNTCVYVQADHDANQRIEYHRGLGKNEGWWRKVVPLFADDPLFAPEHE